MAADKVTDKVMGKDRDSNHLQRHRSFRDRTRTKIEGIIDKAVREAVEDDAVYQANKPERLKEIDQALDDHFRHLFT